MKIKTMKENQGEMANELDRDIENNEAMQMFNLQNSFKPKMFLK